MGNKKYKWQQSTAHLLKTPEDKLIFKKKNLKHEHDIILLHSSYFSYTTLNNITTFLVYAVSCRLQWENSLNIFSSPTPVSSSTSSFDGSVCKSLCGCLYLFLPLYFRVYSCNYSTSTSCNYPPFIKSNNHSSVYQTLSIPNLAATTRLELQPLTTSRHKKTKTTPKYHAERIHPLQSTRDVLSGHG